MPPDRARAQGVEAVEFLDDVSSGRPPPRPGTDASPSSAAVLAALVAFFAVGYLVLASSGPDANEAIVEPSTTAPSTVPPDPTGPPTTVVGWPENMPQLLIGAPGPQEPVIDGRAGVTLLYINVRGNPTIIDLDTGDRFEIAVSPVRDHETFFIELGRVVAVDGNDRPRAGDRAIEVNVVRTGLSREPSDRRDGGASGIWLCLDPAGCEVLPDSEVLTTADDVVRLLDPRRDADVAALFDDDVWERDGRWMLSPDDGDVDLRLPAPAGNAVVWVLHQPEV